MAKEHFDIFYIFGLTIAALGVIVGGALGGVCGSLAGYYIVHLKNEPMPAFNKLVYSIAAIMLSLAIYVIIAILVLESAGRI